MQKYAKTRITMYAVFVTLQCIRKYMVPRKDASCDCLEAKIVKSTIFFNCYQEHFCNISCAVCTLLYLIEHVCVDERAFMCVCLFERAC